MVLAQLNKSKDFKKTLGYTSRTMCNNTQSELPQIIYGNLGASLLPREVAPKEIASQMGSLADLSYRVQRPCYHMILSLPQQDSLSGRQWHDFTRDFLEGMELRDNQAIAYLHNDVTYPDGTERPHVHIVANRVGHNGKAIDTSWDYYRAQSVLRELEKEYGLTPEASSWEVGRQRDSSSQEQRLKPLVQSGRERDPTVRSQLQEVSMSNLEDEMKEVGDQIESQSGEGSAQDSFDRDRSTITADLTGEGSAQDSFDRDRSTTTADLKNVDKQMQQGLHKSLESDKKQRASTRANLERGTETLASLGNQALKLNQDLDGMTMLGASLIGGSMALKAGQAIKDALDNCQDRKRQARIAKISDRIQKIDERSQSLEEKVTAGTKNMPGPTFVSTGSEPDPSKDPVAEILWSANLKVGDLEESLGLERGDSSLEIDPENSFDKQLDQISESLSELENRLDILADKYIDTIDRESASALAPASSTEEKEALATPLYGSDLAQSIVNYSESRAVAYDISPKDPIETRSLGTIQVDRVDNQSHISISDDSYGTKFEAVWDKEEEHWQVQIDDLSEQERLSLSDLPQTPEQYSDQANGKATVQALRTLAQREFDKPDGGCIRWEERQGNYYQITIDNNQSDGSQSVVGVKPETDEEVLRATISPNGSIKINQFNLSLDTVDDLINKADRERLERQRSANSILKKQTSTESLAL